MSKENPTPQKRYHAKFKKQFKIDCFTSTEMDIIEKLESVPKHPLHNPPCLKS